MEDHEEYLENGFDMEFRKKAIQDGLRFLKKDQRGRYDSIAVTGISGLTIGAPLAYLAKKGLTVIRKGGDDTHSTRKIESSIAPNRYVIVDDFAASGETIARIVKTMDADSYLAVVNKQLLFNNIIVVEVERPNFLKNFRNFYLD